MKGRRLPPSLTLTALAFLFGACAPSVSEGDLNGTTHLYNGSLDPAVAGLTGRLNASIPRMLEGYDVPGAAIALVDDGQLVWAAGYGLADVQIPRAVTPETPFQTNSILRESCDRVGGYAPRRGWSS